MANYLTWLLFGLILNNLTVWTICSFPFSRTKQQGLFVHWGVEWEFLEFWDAACLSGCQRLFLRRLLLAHVQAVHYLGKSRAAHEQVEMLTG